MHGTTSELLHHIFLKHSTGGQLIPISYFIEVFNKYLNILNMKINVFVTCK